MVSSLLRAIGLGALALGLCWSALSQPAFAAAMDFKVVSLSFGSKCGKRCPGVMVANGEMTSGTVERFIDFAQQASKLGASNVLIIDSPGGHLVEGVNLGHVLRKLRTSVFVGRVVTLGGQRIAVNGSCMSACVYALMGGNKRFVPTGSRVGVHREYLPNSSGSDPLSVLRSTRRFPEVTQMLRAYSKKMGVNPALIDLAEQYGVGSIRILTPEDIKRFRLARIAN